METAAEFAEMSQKSLNAQNAAGTWTVNKDIFKTTAAQPADSQQTVQIRDRRPTNRGQLSHVRYIGYIKLRNLTQRWR